MKVVIMAGGKGTRISSIDNTIPKPMINIGGMPILEHEINVLKRQGFNDIIITVGHIGEKIIEYFGDGTNISPITGETFGVNIKYYFEESPLGTAGALFKIKDQLTEDFLLLNGDIMFNIDFNRFLEFHRSKNSLATLFTHPNDHPNDSSLIIVNDKKEVIKWLNKKESRSGNYENLVNAGLHIISPKILDDILISKNSIIDLDNDILKPLENTGKLFSYCSPEYVKDMGTPERYYEVSNDYKSKKIEKRNLINKQKAIFLDRDGTINKYKGFITKSDQIELINGVDEAIKLINKSDYLCLVVTNQPIISRGESTIENLKEINNKLETLLGKKGVYIDSLYYCPHHPDKGFSGERRELKIECECRKPKPGMLIKAAQDYNIDLEFSWMIGDSMIDIIAGKNSGCRTALIINERIDLENLNYKPDLMDSDLYTLVKKIIKDK